MKKLLLILLCLPFIGFGQDWVDMMQDPNTNFYQTQSSFNDFWEGKTIEKGKGWKQFKRWENFIEQRVYPDGNLQPQILFEENQNLNSRNDNFRMMPPNVWTQVGPNNVPLEGSGRKRGIGRLNSIVFHPTNADILYVGAPAGGFWKSTNAGQTWSTSTDFLNNLGVSDIAIHPSNPDTLFIVTGDRDGGDTYAYGVMRSYDGGLSWQTTGLSFNITSSYRGNRILIDPLDPNIVIVATSNGVYRSIDGGDNFVHTFPGENLVSMEFHTTNSNIIFAGSKGNTSVYKSVDNGINWSQSGSGLPSTNDVRRACIAVTNDNPNVVYALFGNNDNGFYGLYKSIDEGNSWTQQSNSPNLLGWSTNGSDNGGQAWYDLALTVSPTDEDIVFVGGVNCWKSDDGGVNWNLNTHWYGGGGANYMHADEHMLQYNSLDNKVYSANDGGLYYSDDDGNNWTDISDGLQITQFYKLGVSQTVQDLVIGGTQDNGTFLKNNLNWDAVIGGDGMECIIDYSDEDIMYGSVYYGDIRKSTNGGNSFSSIAPANNGAWVTPYILDRTDPQTIFIGYEELYKSDDGGNSWNIITSNETNGGKIDQLQISKSNPDVIYFSDNANIFKTNDGGNNWTNVSSSLPNKTITSIAIHPTNEDKLWISFSGYSSGEKVYFSEDSGSNWSNISGTLPNVPANTIVLNEMDSLETIYLGTDLGVFIKDSTTNDWNNFNNNSLPNVIVSELEIQYPSNKLIAATYGRGLWNIDLLITSPPLANFNVDDSVFCNIPATVNFTNTSYYSNSYYWDFGDGNFSTSTNPSHTYSNFGIYTVSLISTGPLGVDSVVYQSIININQSNPCIITLPSSGEGILQTNCNGTLYDVGGPNGNYYDNNNAWMTISPPGSNQITLNFTDFDIEAPSSQNYCNWDYLEIFDGADTSAPSLGQYCNALTGTPGTIISSGGSITVYLHADQAVNGRGFEASWSCTFPQIAPSTLFDVSDTVSCSGIVSFTDLSLNGPDTWLWDFGDGNFSSLQNPTHTYLNPGRYSVSLQTSNQYGIDSLSVINYISVFDYNITSSNLTVCQGEDATINAFSDFGIINWYSDSLLTNFIDTGSSLTISTLNNSATYYSRNEFAFLNIFGGPNNNSFGSGGYYQGNRHLVFNNYKPSKLVSVLVYANSDSVRHIELRNSSNLVLQDTLIYIPYSPQGVRVNLNFDLPVENNLQIGINGSNSDLYRNDNGAIFPYNISNCISITGTNASLGYYYFFYDWEIEVQSCYSNISQSNISVNNISINTDTVSICLGDSVLVGSNYYYSAGLYNDTLSNSFGCDSIINTNLIVGTSSIINQNITICNGENYFVGLNSYSISGNYSDTISFGGCDSIINTNLIVLPTSGVQQSLNLCNGEVYFIGNNIYTQSGNYIDTLISLNGCDSIVYTNLIFNNNSTTNNNFSICSGDTVLVGGSSYYAPGFYIDSLYTFSGCDSIIYTNLVVYPLLYEYLYFSICLGDSVIIGNNSYTQAGSYLDTLISTFNCDSIISTVIDESVPISNLFENSGVLTFNVSGGTPLYNIQLYGPNGLVVNLLNNNGASGNYTPILNGTYFIVSEDQNGCFADTVFITIDFIASSILSDINELRIYPNPSDNFINIEFQNLKENNFYITIENTLGQEIFRDYFLYTKSSFFHKIDVSSFSNGVYYLNINTPNGIITNIITIK